MTISHIVLYSSLAALAMMAGSALVFYAQGWARSRSIFLISFAAGVMLTIAFAGLIPQATSFYPNAVMIVFGGFLCLYAIQNIVMFHPCHDDVCQTHSHSHSLGVFSLGGLTVHSFLDGVIVVVGFEAGWSIGVLTTLAVLFHKLPDGITITGILLHTGMKTRVAATLSALVALATPLGALIAYFFLRGIGTTVLGILLAMTAGSFIYLATADLLPETHKIRHRANAFFFFGGTGIILLVEHFLH